MTSSNGNIFRATGHLCGEFTGPGDFPAQRPLTQSFDVFFDLCPNKRLSKQSSGWWFEMPSRPLWRHHNLFGTFQILDLSFEKGAPKAAPRKVIIVNLSIACVLDVFTLCQKYCFICFVHYHYSDISWSSIHYGDVNRPSRRLELPINRVFVQQFVQADNKVTSKVRVTAPLWGEFTGGRWISRTKVQLRGKCFHLMTSLCRKDPLTRKAFPVFWRLHDYNRIF